MSVGGKKDMACDRSKCIFCTEARAQHFLVQGEACPPCAMLADATTHQLRWVCECDEHGRPVLTTPECDLSTLVAWCSDHRSQTPTLRPLSEVAFATPKRPRDDAKQEAVKCMRLAWHPNNPPPWDYCDFSAFLYHEPRAVPEFLEVESIDDRQRVYFQVRHPTSGEPVHVMLHLFDIMPEPYKKAIDAFAARS